MERGNDLKEKKEDIEKMIKNTEPFLKLSAQMYNKDIIILLGRTRAGKSTLANYLLGNKLISVNEKIGNTYKLEVVLNGQGPPIGKGSVSATKIPTVHTLPDGGILIDSPGFEDNRGISQDIFNAICINHIRFANSVKFVLVCYIGDLVNDNIQNFTSLLEKMAALVVNFEKIYKSVSIIFTKDQNDSTLDQLRKAMRDNILKESELAVDKRLLPTLTENTSLIGIFKSPLREGEILVKLLDVNVKNAIDACSYVNVTNLKIRFPLADESKVCLREMYLYYTESSYFESEIERTVKCIINYLNVDEYVFASYGKELHVVKHKVLKPLRTELKLLLEYVFNNLEELNLALQAVMDVRKLKLSTEFKSHFEFILLLDNALLLEENFRKLVIKNCKTSTSRLLNNVQQLIDKIDAEYHRRTNENILLLYEAINFKHGFSTFHLGIELAKAKIINSVQTATRNRTCTVRTPDTEPLIPRAPSKIDIPKLAEASIVGTAMTKPTMPKAALAEVAASRTVAGGTICEAGAANTAAVGAGAVGTAVIGAVAAGAAAAGAATSLSVVAGAATSGAVAVGAAALGTVACGAGMFAAGFAVSSVHFSTQYSLINRSEIRRKQKRDINNENYIFSSTIL